MSHARQPKSAITLP